MDQIGSDLGQRHGHVGVHQDIGIGYRLALHRADLRVPQGYVDVDGPGCVPVPRVADPADLERVLKQAVEHDGPTLVEIVTQELQDAAAPVSRWMG